MDEKVDPYDVAKYLGVSERTVRNLIRRGELPPPIRIGRKRFWLTEQFTRWLHDHGTTPVRLRSTRNPIRRPLSGC
jgi:excisionase family DNA binding protein